MNVKKSANKNKTTILVISLLLTLLSPLYAQYFNVQNLDQRFLENLERMDVFEQLLMEKWNPTFYALQNPDTYVVDKLGSYYTMQNGTTGALKYRTMNGGSVLNSAWGNLSGLTGSIFIKTNVVLGSTTWNLTTGSNTRVRITGA